MSIWFEGEGEIGCSLEQVENAVEKLGEFFTGVVRLMPGLADVELVAIGGSAPPRWEMRF